MSNWFETNPTKSVIGHTIAVAGITWAVSTFILQDNRVNLLKAEIDSQRAIAEQYKSKADLLSKDLETVRAENAEFRAWLNQSKDAVPAIMPRITELKNYIAALEAKSSRQPRAQQFVQEARRGNPATDEITGVRVEVQEVTIEKMASILVKFPDRDTKVSLEVKGGETFPFKLGPVDYKLAILRVYYIADGIEFAISQEAKK